LNSLKTEDLKIPFPYIQSGRGIAVLLNGITASDVNIRELLLFQGLDFINKE